MVVSGNYTLGYAPTTKTLSDQSVSSTDSLSNVSGTVEGSKITYPAALGDGLNVEYQVAWNGLKEVLRLEKRPATKGNLTIHGTLFYNTSALTLYANQGNVTSTASTNGSLEFRNATGETILIIPKGWARDWSAVDVPTDPGLAGSVQAGRWSEITYNVKRSGSVTYLDAIVPSSFLFDAATTYPVEIDPSLGPYVASPEEHDFQQFQQTSDLTILPGGNLILRNSSLTWEGNYNLNVQPGGSLLLDNTSMTSEPWVAAYNLNVQGGLQLVNAAIRGRLGGWTVNPPASAAFSVINTNVTGGAGNCIFLSGLATPLTVTGSTFYGCGNAGLVLSGGTPFPGTWTISNTRFNDSLYGLYFLNGSYAGATISQDTFEHSRIAGLEADNAVATVSNCNAVRNARGWASVNAAQLTVTTCTGEGNSVAAYAVGGHLTLTTDTLTNSSTWDLYCVAASNCAINGGNNPQWVTLALNSNLTYRHELKLTIVGATAAPLPQYRVYVEDRYGDPAAPESYTNATGQVDLFVSDRRIQPDNSVTFYTPHNIHLGYQYAVTTVIDSDWDRTLYATGDMDNDTIPDSVEADPNAYWFDAANHVISQAQLNLSTFSNRPTVVRDLSGQFIANGTFPDMPAGVYRIAIEAWANATGLPLVVQVANGAGALLLANTTFSMNDSVAWYFTPNFTLSTAGRLSPQITDPNLGPVGAEAVSTIAILRVADAAGVNTTARPGQVTNPVVPDTDSDGAPDGAERRNTSFWQEAELIAQPSFFRVAEGNASSGAAAEHPTGNATILSGGYDGLAVNHTYQLRARARATIAGAGAHMLLGFTCGATDNATTVLLGEEYSWILGPTCTATTAGTSSVRAADVDDMNVSDGTNFVRLDEIALLDLNASNEFGLWSNPLAGDTDFDGLNDGSEISGFFTADFVNASEGVRGASTALSGPRVVFDDVNDWVNLSVAVRYPGDARFYIAPEIYVADGMLDAKRNATKDLVLVNLSDGLNRDIVPDVNFSFFYLGSSSPPTQGGLTQLQGWYSWVYRNLTAGTYHLKLRVNASAAANLAAFTVYVNHVYVQKRALDPMNADYEGDGVLDGLEVALGTFPLNPDSDYDHLGDWEEIFPGNDGWITNPLSNDTDGDGLPDSVEVGGWGDADNSTRTNPTNPDTDGDGLRAAERTTRAGGSPALAKALLAM